MKEGGVNFFAEDEVFPPFLHISLKVSKPKVTAVELCSPLYFSNKRRGREKLWLSFCFDCGICGICGVPPPLRMRIRRKGETFPLIHQNNILNIFTFPSFKSRLRIIFCVRNEKGKKVFLFNRRKRGEGVGKTFSL